MNYDFSKLSVDELKNLIDNAHDELNNKRRGETEKLLNEAIVIFTKLNKIDPYIYVVNSEGDMTYLHDLIVKDNWAFE